MDWLEITPQQFDELILSSRSDSMRVSRALLERLPWIFENKTQYLEWRDSLAEGFGVDGRDIALVGSAAVGRSLNPSKGFKPFHQRSDIDIAVISPYHFDIAWRWFRQTNVNFISGIDAVGREKFEAHKHYIFEGVIAAEYFLSFLPFGNEWVTSLQRSESLLPARAAGHFPNVRIYRDHTSLREYQIQSIKTYTRRVQNRAANREQEED